MGHPGPRIPKSNDPDWYLRNEVKEQMAEAEFLAAKRGHQNEERALLERLIAFFERRDWPVYGADAATCKALMVRIQKYRERG